jgi:hypothetical protein
MYNFSTMSKERLNTCHEDLQTLFRTVIKHVDCSVVGGWRSKDQQNEYFDKGKSKVKYPNGKHNSLPSVAVDVAPFLNGKISWDMKNCLYFAGIVMGIALMLNIKVRWGGDWDMDNEAMTDQKFQDLVHFELVGR